MGGIAQLARALGHEVTGSDKNVYPPMSTQLEAAGIRIDEGYEPAHLRPAPDVVVVGNAISRGNPALEHALDQGLRYTSGPQWLAENLLQGRWVLAVAGTHGKTTTSAMLAWILEKAGLAPGFLIGGVPSDFGVSARIGADPFFVVEADEYDTAFFDKRSKFVHYRPRTLVLNNLEFDHADIFDDLSMIQRQFHHLVRTVPAGGRILHPERDPALAEVLARGCWTPCETFDASGGREWSADERAPDGSRFRVLWQEKPVGEVTWRLTGAHNVSNALAAIGAARHAGVPPGLAAEALSSFGGVKRRMELRGEAAGIKVYDDFAHHPTAIASTLGGLRAHAGCGRIIAVLEPRSNTMRLGVHRETLAQSLALADSVYLYAPPDLPWDAKASLRSLGAVGRVRATVQGIVDEVAEEAARGDQVLVMSNGGFEGIHQRLLERLGRRDSSAGGEPFAETAGAEHQ